MQPWLDKLLAAAAVASIAAPAMAGPDAARLYKEHCVSCHGESRLGGTGPALLPGNLRRLKPARAAKVIANGRAATQMPAFADTLASDEIAALSRYIHEPPAVEPVWDKDEIAASRELTGLTIPVTAPSYSADPLNLFVVVETGDHHATILDGDKFEPLDRFETPYALHGGPKFTPEGRYVFLMSRDGWVMKYDLWALKVTGKVRAGINSRNIAISRDGKYLAVANYLPHTLVILSTGDLSVQKIFKVVDRKGTSSRVSAVYQAPQRNSFIAALKDVPEI